MRFRLLLWLWAAAGAVLLITGPLSPRAAAQTLLVSNFDTNTIQRFDAATGVSLGTLVSSGSGGLDGPLAMAIGPDGSLYLSSVNTNTVKRYNALEARLFEIRAYGGVSKC